MRHNYKIEYAGIKLVPMDAIASEKYRLLRNIPDIRKWFAFKGIISEENQSEWFERYLENPKDVMFAILDDNDSFLGCNSIYDINEDGSAEYGRLIIDPSFSGKGFGYKATCAAVQIAKNQMNLKCLKLEVYRNNISAITSYKKALFVETGIIIDEQGNPMSIMEIRL